MVFLVVAGRAATTPSAAPAARTRTSGRSAIAQVGWVALVFLRAAGRDDVRVMAIAAVAIELTGPLIAERRKGGTPVARRTTSPSAYGLLGDHHARRGHHRHGRRARTRVVHGEAGWTVDAALVAVAGIGSDLRLPGGCTSRLPWAAVRSPLHP